nr:GntG family PLP-dependent aldolase [Brucepastera parasyntrophica]
MPRGSEIILDDSCHIIQHEAGAAGVIAGVQTRTIDFGNEMISFDRIKKYIRTEDDMHQPKTSLICLENAHSNGKVIPLSVMENIRRGADRYHVPIHLDGARLFNAATALHVQAKDITQYVDSVMFCLSKGLCSPVGSILAGTHKFIDEARRKRKIMGGALRQSGVLAAAGLVALKDMRRYLETDHENAQFMAEKLAEIPGIIINPEDVQINMVFFNHEQNETINSEAFVEFMKDRNVLVNNSDADNNFRLVTHYWVDREHILTAVKAIKEFYAQE